MAAISPIRRWAALLLAGALAACGPKKDAATRLDSLDAELTGANAAAPANDPALRAALHDQIMVDPDLVGQANRDAVRPPPRPVSGALPSEDITATAAPTEHDRLRAAPPASADCPQCLAARRALTLGALAQSQGGRAAACSGAIAYSAAWANRLPAAVPLYPDARVLEAAGADGPGCALRIVSFRSSAPAARLLDWYYTRTSSAGYAAQHQADGGEHILAGTRPAGGAFLVILRPRGPGTDVDLMADAR